MHVFDQSGFNAPALAIVVRRCVGVSMRIQRAAQREARAQRRRAGQRRLLFDYRDRQPVPFLDLAVVEFEPSCDGIQQRALAGAVTSDQSNTIADVYRQRCAVEQRMQAEREFGIENRQ